MRSKIGVCAFVVGTILATSGFAQDKGTQSNPAPVAAVSGCDQTPKRIRIGGNVQQAMLVHQVLPVYPPDAKAARIRGNVVFHAIIGENGSVQNLELISGSPLLVRSAIDAAKQWHYRPTFLNGEPVEVDTTITVVFTLGGETPSAPEVVIAPQLKTDILHCLDVAHAKEKEISAGRTLSESMRPRLAESLPPTPNRDKILDSYVIKLIALLQTEEFADRWVAVYAKYLSDDDIKALTQFYETPAGQHFNAAMPQLVGDLNRLGRKW